MKTPKLVGSGAPCWGDWTRLTLRAQGHDLMLG